jgi:hypothetical protein
MKLLHLKNDGYIKDTLTKELFSNLREESMRCERNTDFSTGIDDIGFTCPHYNLSEDNKKQLFEFLTPYISKYDENYHYIKELKFLSQSSPWVFDDPWYNLQTPMSYLPGHTHDGVLSYTIWLKLPPRSRFTFVYSSITGKLYYHNIILTPKDEGKFIIFPSTLNHMVDPYKGDVNEVRISVAGNICLRG